jgi:hypothetical protein
MRADTSMYEALRAADKNNFTIKIQCQTSSFHKIFGGGGPGGPEI